MFVRKKSKTDLDDNPVTDRRLTVNLADLCMTVVEIQQRDLLVNLLRRITAVRRN